ncbi:MAG: hypothetical protein NT031_18395, partial [Planctomycetota bacterium]|nr:hypothetical protein [Planctomycetota bacterium]
MARNSAHPVFNSVDATTGAWKQIVIDLGAELAKAGMAPAGTLYVRFQAYSSYGYAAFLDDVVVTAKTQDWYSLSLTAGQKASFGLVVPEGGDATVRVYDPAGRLAALSTPSAGDYYRLIQNMTATASGRYSVQVTSDFSYDVVVAKDAALDEETDVGQAAGAQGLTGQAASGSLVAPPLPVTAFKAVVTGQATLLSLNAESDFFKFYARAGSTVTATLVADYNTPALNLISGAMTSLASNYSSSNTLTLSTVTLSATGDYYINATFGPRTSADAGKIVHYTLTLTLTSSKLYYP